MGVVMWQILSFELSKQEIIQLEDPLGYTGLEKNEALENAQEEKCEFSTCPLETSQKEQTNTIIYESYPDIEDPVLDCRDRGGEYDSCFGTCDAPYYCSEVCLSACHVKDSSLEPVACTKDAKMCPDGSYVGRAGPNCEFEACPVPEENEKPKVVTCSPESKLAQACTMEYRPVCGFTNIQCVTTPCDPIEETFSNGCMACAEGSVDSYIEGSCDGEEPYAR